MKWLHLLQFRIRSFMLLITAIACALALVQWAGPLGAIVIGVWPCSLFVERLFTGPPPAPHRQPSFWGYAANLIVLILCAALCTVASWCGSARGTPTILSPLPLFVVIPLFVASGLGCTQPWCWWFVAPIPFGTFLMMNFYQLRSAGLAPLPMRFSFLLGLATAFSVYLFVGGWKYGVRYQGTTYTLASAAINLSFLLLLWGWWLAVRQRASKASTLGFATSLHCWLFWFAFPYLGELP
jgi:hypothetical protein